MREAVPRQVGRRRYHWDFSSGAALTIDQANEEIFITRNGIKLGPYTSAQVLAAFHATSK